MFHTTTDAFVKEEPLISWLTIIVFFNYSMWLPFKMHEKKCKLVIKNNKDEMSAIYLSIYISIYLFADNVVWKSSRVLP